MALKLKTSESFWWPVTVAIPLDGGKFDQQTFDVQFRRLGVDAVTSFIERIAKGEMSPAAGVRELVTGWRGIVDGDADVPFSETALAQVLDIPGVGPAILSAFREAMRGEARRGN